MKTWTADEVRTTADNPALLWQERDQLLSYADLLERIKVGESAVPVAEVEELHPGYVRCPTCTAQFGGYGYGEWPKVCPVCQDNPPTQPSTVSDESAVPKWIIDGLRIIAAPNAIRGGAREYALEMLEKIGALPTQPSTSQAEVVDAKPSPIGFVYVDESGRFIFTRNKTRKDADPTYLHPTPYQIADHPAEPAQAAQVPDGWVLVQREPTEAMVDAGRSAVMARDCSAEKWGPADHYEASGISRDGIPDRLFEGRGKMSKAWGAELVYCAMLAAAPTPAKDA